jgi:hypothetical protein
MLTFSIVYPRLGRRIRAGPYAQGQARARVGRPLAPAHPPLGQGYLRIPNRGPAPCACDFPPSVHLHGGTASGARGCDEAQRSSQVPIGGSRDP